MDHLTARLHAEKNRRPSTDEISGHNETLRRITEDLDLFLAEAAGRRHYVFGGHARTVASAAAGLSAPYQTYDVGNALTRPCRT